MTKGRPREFERHDALEQAMLVFWRNGYRGASLDDLTGAMSIARPSLYAAFGDKEQLFLESIDHYRTQHIFPIFRKLVEADSLNSGLSAFFRAFARLVTSRERPAGCFIACVLTEEACVSSSVREKLATVMKSADEGFTKVLQSHADELNEHITPAQAAQMLTSFLQGLSIRARGGASESDLAKIASPFIRTILR